MHRHTCPGAGLLRATLGAATVAAALTLASVGAASGPGGADTLHVDAEAGDDAAAGTAPAPLRTLQRALDLAQPGTTIVLRGGVHAGAATRRAGTAEAPITIRGSESGREAGARFRTVVQGDRIVLRIDHSHYRLTGFTVNGQPALPASAYPRTLDEARAFKDSVQGRVVNSKLIYVGYDPAARDITGVVFEDLFLHGGGGECVRFRNNAFGNLVAHSVIQWCGMAPSGDDRRRYRYHNGEGVYIGTSPKSVEQPMHANDASHHNVVRDSLIRTFGSECFQVKENAHHNVLRRVDCRDNDEPLRFGGSNVELRGGDNLIEGSTLAGSRGVNLKIASDEPRFDRGGNAVIGSRFDGAAGGHILFRSRMPPGRACGNTFTSAAVFEAAPMGDPARGCGER